MKFNVEIPKFHIVVRLLKLQSVLYIMHVKKSSLRYMTEYDTKITTQCGPSN